MKTKTQKKKLKRVNIKTVSRSE